jgi:hypothetical protein
MNLMGDAELMAFISFSQNAFYQWRAKALSPWLWDGWELLVMNLLSAPGGKEFWKERGYVSGRNTGTMWRKSS